jgi:hypothetical protein
LLTLAGPITLHRSCCQSFPAAPKDIRVAGLPAALRQPNLFFRRHFEPFLERRRPDGLVAWVYTRRFPNPAAKEDTVDDLGVAAPAANSYYVK